MRIAMVGPFGFHPKKTMRSRALPLAQSMSEQGHEVRMFMPPWHTPKEGDREWDEKGVQIRYIPLSGGVLARSRRLVKETLGWRPDIVHTFKPKAYSGLTAWWLWQFYRHRLKIVTDSDDWEGWGGWNDVSPYTESQKRFFSWQERWGLTHCHALTAASLTLRSMALSLGAREDQVHYLPNGPGIDSSQFVPAEADSQDKNPAGIRRAALGLMDRPVVLIYSRWFEFDSRRLVRILELVRKEVQDLAILLVGVTLHEEDAAEFRWQAESVGLDRSIVDLGWVDEADLPATLAAADVGLYLMDDTLLNRTKCPVKLADMLVMSVPVVGESIGQVPEYVIDQSTGLLYESGDEEGTAAGLVKLLRDKGERARMGSNGRAYILEQFNWSKLAEKTLKIYAEI